jgi:hypothetical protein
MFLAMAVLKKKTRKKMRKAIDKAVAKHGPRIARHLVTGVAAGIATYLGAEGDKGAKKLKKVAKSFPGGKVIGDVIAATVPVIKNAANNVTGSDSNSRSDNKRAGDGGKKKSQSG